MAASALHQRLRAVAGARSFREIADVTATHPESVRRYIQGQAPSVEFLTAFSKAYDVSASWLLHGVGPMRAGDARAHALREANASELLAAIAFALERLTERVERLEVFLHTLESRLHAHATLTATASSVGGPLIEPKPSQEASAGQQASGPSADIHTHATPPKPQAAGSVILQAVQRPELDAATPEARARAVASRIVPRSESDGA